jgi:hypothetical protein
LERAGSDDAVQRPAERALKLALGPGGADHLNAKGRQDLLDLLMPPDDGTKPLVVGGIDIRGQRGAFLAGENGS